MGSEKEAQLVKRVGIISAVFLVVLMVSVSYLIIKNQQVNNLISQNVEVFEEPTIVRNLNERDAQMLLVASELEVVGEGIILPNGDILEPLEGSPGVYIVHIVNQDSEETTPEEAYVIIKK